MRITAAILLLLLVCTPATARTPASEAELQAAREIVEVFTGESTMALAIESQMPALLARLQQSVTSADFYPSLRPETRQALDGYVDTMPTLVREQVMATVLLARGDFEHRLVDRYAEDELVRLAALVTDPTFHAFLVRSVQAHGAGETFTEDDLNEEEREAFARLEASTDMRGLPHMWDVARMLSESVAAATVALRPAFQQRFATELCGVLSDECPAYIRAYAAPSSD